MATKDEIKDRLLKQKSEANEIRKEFWKNLTLFQTIDDIPDLPIVNKDEWNNFYVPILIRCGAIPKDKLIPGCKYEGACRNASIAVWTGNKFIYKRTKYGTTYDEEINHFQDDDGSDLFVPLKKI